MTPFFTVNMESIHTPFNVSPFAALQSSPTVIQSDRAGYFHHNNQFSQKFNYVDLGVGDIAKIYHFFYS